MSKVFSAHAVSVDGYISGRTPDGDEEFGRGLGDAPMLFDWYTDGDTPSQVFDGFKLSEPSARFFDAVAARVGAAVAGRTTYEHSGHGEAVARTRRRGSSSSATGPRPRSARRRPSSPAASRTPSPLPVRPPAIRTSPSWAAAC
jgi:hypothetical protein